MSDIIDLNLFRKQQSTDAEQDTEKLLSSINASILPFSPKGKNVEIPVESEEAARRLLYRALFAIHFHNEYLASHDGEATPIYGKGIDDYIATLTRGNVADIGSMGFYTAIDLWGLKPDDEAFDSFRMHLKYFNQLYSPDEINSLEDFKIELERATAFGEKSLMVQFEILSMDNGELKTFYSNSEDNGSSLKILSQLSPQSRAVFAAIGIAGGSRVRELIIALGSLAEYKTPYSFSAMEKGIVTPSGITQIANMFEHIERNNNIENDQLSIVAHGVAAFFRAYQRYAESAGTFHGLLQSALEKGEARISRLASRTRFDIATIPLTDEHINIYRNHYSIHPTLGEMDYWQYFRVMHRLDARATERFVERVSAESQRLATQAFTESKFYSVKQKIIDDIVSALDGCGVHIKLPPHGEVNRYGLTLELGVNSLSVGITAIDEEDLTKDRVKVNASSYAENNRQTRSWVDDVLARFESFGEQDSWVIIAACHQWIDQHYCGLDFEKIYDFKPEFKLEDSKRYEFPSRAREWMKEAIEQGVLPRDMKYTISKTYGGYCVNISELPEGMMLYRPHYKYLMEVEHKANYDERMNTERRENKYTDAYRNLKHAILLVLDGVKRDMLHDGTYVFRDGPSVDCDVDIRATDKLQDRHDALCQDVIEHAIVGTTNWEKFDEYQIQPYQFNNKTAFIESVPFVDLPPQKKKWVVNIDMACLIHETYKSMAAKDNLLVLSANRKGTVIQALDQLLNQRLPKGADTKRVCEVLQNTKNMLIHSSTKQYNELAFLKMAKQARSLYTYEEKVAMAKDAAKSGMMTVMQEADGRAYSWIVDDQNQYTCPRTGQNYCTTLALVVHRIGEYPNTQKFNSILARVDIPNLWVEHLGTNLDPTIYLNRIKYDDSLIELANARSHNFISVLNNSDITEDYHQTIAPKVMSTYLRSISSYSFIHSDKSPETKLGTDLKVEAFRHAIKEAIGEGILTKNQGQTLLILSLRAPEQVFSSSVFNQAECGSLILPNGKSLNKDGTLIDWKKNDLISVKDLHFANKMRAGLQAIGSLDLTEAQIASIRSYRKIDKLVDKVCTLPNDVLKGAVVTRNFNGWELHMPDGSQHHLSKRDGERIEKMLLSHGTSHPLYHDNENLAADIKKKLELEYLSEINMLSARSGAILN